MKISSMIESVKKNLSDHSPELLLGFGIAGMASAAVMAVKATPRAIELLEDKEDILDRDLTKIEMVKVAWKPYIPAAIGFSVSAACLISANSINAKRNAMLATAYHISERALTEYVDKVVEVVGEEKEREIRDAVSRDRMKSDPVTQQDVIITGSGNVLCYDSISGRYFQSDMEKIKKAENQMNYRLNHDMYCSLNDFYEEIGLSCTDVGDIMGWNVNDGLLELYFTTQITDDGRPCLVINYVNGAKHDYDKL